MANIGKSISIHGDLTGDEDLLLEGTVEGKVHLPNNELTIGADGRIPAEVHAKSVIVIGHVKGDVHAKERVEIRASGVVEGDIFTPRLVVADGAVLNGRIETTGSSSATTASAGAGPGAAGKPPRADAPRASKSPGASAPPPAG